MSFLVKISLFFHLGQICSSQNRPHTKKKYSSLKTPTTCYLDSSRFTTSTLQKALKQFVSQLTLHKPPSASLQRKITQFSARCLQGKTLFANAKNFCTSRAEKKIHGRRRIETDSTPKSCTSLEKDGGRYLSRTHI